MCCVVTVVTREGWQGAHTVSVVSVLQHCQLQEALLCSLHIVLILLPNYSLIKCGR